MKRRILLVDDEVAVLLTLKAILEISGFDVDTATSAREGKSRIRTREYEMVITDMRMEDEHAGKDVIEAAKAAAYKPAIALLTAFPMEDAAWEETGADKMLIKPMHTRVLLQQLEALFVRRHGAPESKEKLKTVAASNPSKSPVSKKDSSISQANKKSAPKRAATDSKKVATKPSPIKKVPVSKTSATKKAMPAKRTSKKVAAKR